MVKLVPMKSFRSRPGIGALLARAGHVVGQRHDLAVAVVRADQVGVGDPAVVDRLARLHRGLQLLDDVAFLDDVVLDLDAGDLLEGLGQRLRFVLVRRDRLGDHRDLLDALGLQLLGGVDEPLHLGHLLVLAQSVDGWNSLSIHFFASASPAHALWPRRQRGRGEGHRMSSAISCWSPLVLPVVDMDTPAGKRRPDALETHQPLRMISASTSIETTKLIQIEGSCSRPNQLTIFSLTPTKARLM